MNRAIFLDRDGTLNEEAEYLSDPAGLVLLPGAGEALKVLTDMGFLLVVVSNQSGVARGYFGIGEVEAVNERLAGLLRPYGVHFDLIAYCPHHPDHTGPCSCRKPEPGMLMDAARKLDVDLSRSWMVGDKLADVEAGAAAGCRTALVLTGYGKKELAKAGWRGVKPDLVEESLSSFARNPIILKDILAMPVKPELLAILVCPRCKGKLTLRAEVPALDCEACRLRYPIEDSIPVMIVEEAKPL